MTELSRKHFFRDDNDGRSVVETSLMFTGRYCASLVETEGGVLELLDLCGYGHTRLAAIADLQAWIENNEEA